MTASVQYLFHIVYNPARYCGDGNEPEPATANALQLVIERWAAFETALQARGPYFLGDRYSLLDIFALMMATWFYPIENLLTTYPAYRKNFILSANRPSVRKILDEHELDIPLV